MLANRKQSVVGIDTCGVTSLSGLSNCPLGSGQLWAPLVRNSVVFFSSRHTRLNRAHVGPHDQTARKRGSLHVPPDFSGEQSTVRDRRTGTQRFDARANVVRTFWHDDGRASGPYGARLYLLIELRAYTSLTGRVALLPLRSRPVQERIPGTETQRETDGRTVYSRRVP